MKKLSQAILYYLLFGSCYLLSLLPLRGLYVLSDCLYYLIYYVARYRRRVVWRNLTLSFPEKNEKEILSIEKKFYSMLCDYFFESIKLASISRKEMLRRMRFEGLDPVNELAGKGRSVAFYLTHSFNWEWITSFPMHVPNEEIVFGQIYRKLTNKTFDRLFIRLRERFGAISIPMADTARTMMTYKKNNQPAIIGFVADQAPGWNIIDHWINFMNQETAVITGTERIIKKVNSAVVFCELVNIKRGYYVCRVLQLIEDTKQIPDYELTDMYYRYLETSIRENPSSWLWTHKRWKRTKEGLETFKREQEALKERRMENVQNQEK